MNTFINKHAHTLLFGYLISNKAINRFIAALASIALFATTLIASTYYGTLEACGVIVTNKPMLISIVVFVVDVLILLVLLLSELLERSDDEKLRKFRSTR